MRELGPESIRHRYVMGNKRGASLVAQAKASTRQRRRHGFHPRSRKVPHAAGQLSPRTARRQPVLQRPGATATEPMCRNYGSPNALGPVPGGERAALLTAARGQPAHQRRPRAAQQTQLSKRRERQQKGRCNHGRPAAEMGLPR